MDFSTILSQYGLAGVVIFSLASAVLYLNSELGKARAETKAMVERYIALQETRRTESAEQTDKIVKVMADFSDVQKILTDKIHVVKQDS